MPAKGSGAGRVKGGPQITVRLTDAELAELQSRASASHTTCGEYLRRSSLAGWNGTIPPIVRQPTIDASIPHGNGRQKTDLRGKVK